MQKLNAEQTQIDTDLHGQYQDMAGKRRQKKASGSISRRKDAVQAAIDWGIDIPMLIDNLKRSPAERIRQHQIALNTMLKLRMAKHL